MLRSLEIFTLIFLITQFGQVLGQNIKITGQVTDDITHLPVENVNIVVSGTNTGVITDKDGNFEISVPRIPAEIVLSCVGYKKLEYRISENVNKKLHLTLMPSVTTLPEVEININKVKYIFNDNSNSVLDYELYNGNLLILMYRRQLSKSQIVYMTTEGDTISVARVPELNPSKLFRDFLGNVHYVSSKGNAFQCFYDQNLRQIRFIHKTSFDSLARIVSPFLFSTGDRYYFQTSVPGSFEKRIGYIDTAHRQVIIKNISDEKIWKEMLDDQKFDQNWARYAVNGSINFENQLDVDARARRLFYYNPINSPVVKLNGDSIAIFNFPENRIEIFNKDGVVFSVMNIDFHISEENDLGDLFGFLLSVSKWKWSGTVIYDEYFRDVYTAFSKNGMTEIKQINMMTGKIGSVYKVPVAFPVKINIYGKTAYFMYKGISSEWDTWKLASFKLN